MIPENCGFSNTAFASVCAISELD